ncbi:EamA family transporter [Isoptericola sp. NPDC056618]|uniref:EamA family transporter n=1 Tax=Isoptericola sp. NPDC056618 TaxID=3345878 RepID=UPI0036747A76
MPPPLPCDPLTVGALLALASALLYGVSDVVGGIVSRRMPFVRVALWGQVGGLVVTGVVAPFAGGAGPTSADLLWGGLSGVGTGVAMVALFRGMSRGAMSLVVPVSAVGGLALPVVVAALALGERPAPWTWTGVLLALPALWLVARGGPGAPAGDARAVRDGLTASVGIGVQYLALAQSGGGSGIWPVAAGRVTAVGCVAALALLALRRPPAEPRPAPTPALRLAAASSGVLAAAALVCYLLAARTELVAVAVTLSALYPVVPVLVGLKLLHERLARRQALGLALTLAASALVVVP